MWETIKSPFLWIAEKWDQFEVWFASKVPWLRSKAIALMGSIGSAAFLLQGYITEVPINQIVDAKNVMLITFALSTVIYFVRRLGTK